MTSTEPQITIRATEDERPGWTQVALGLDGKDRVSGCGILALEMRIGAATVRMDGIGGVDTDEAYRCRGLARQVLDAAVAHMTAGDAALTMLYGIVDFYPRFGYATAGADDRVTLPVPDRTTEPPQGWSVRGFTPTDLPRIIELFDRTLETSSGAVVRDPQAYPWTRLRAVAEDERAHECRVVTGPDGEIRAYAWRGRGCGFVDGYGHDDPNHLIIADAVAADPAAAEVLLDACGSWAREEAGHEQREITHVALVIAPEGLVSAAALTRSAVFSQKVISTGGSMVRVLDVARLLRQLRPELDRRVRSARLPWRGRLRVGTDIGSAVLVITDDGVEVTDQQDVDAVLELPQTALARLALGVLPPPAVLAALTAPPSVELAQVVELIFPQRHPHLSLVDRY